MTPSPPQGGWDKCLDRTYGIRRFWMTDERKTDILQRLKSVEGHVRGIGRMVEEEAYCIDVVNQI
ncbi:MAG: metal-sensitive transcriptional regulator, partial [Methylococcales bacterium]|nr:metal-sensitive transcriptional regulator [Methylococcales bacterium]